MASEKIKIIRFAVSKYSDEIRLPALDKEDLDDLQKSSDSKAED